MGSKSKTKAATRASSRAALRGEILRRKKPVHARTKDPFLAAIIESSHDAIISKDLDGRITSWNKGAERIFGYTEAEVIGQPISIIIPPDRLNEEPHILNRIRSGERVDHFETVRRHKKGSLVHISLTISPIRDADGRIIGASKIARDITEQIQRREQLRQSEQRFRITLASIGDAVIATDKLGRVTFMNSVAEKLTGWKTKESQGLPLDRVFRIRNEITRQPVENPVARVMQTGGVVGLGNHTLLVSKDGTEQPIDDSAAPISGGNGDLTGVVLVFRDATRQRAAEMTARKLMAFLEDSQDAIYSTDLDGLITSWNSAAERIFGYSAPEIVGQPNRAIIPADRVDEERQILDKIYRGERVEHYETVRQRKDGSKIDISLMVSAIRELPSGQVAGVTKVARDITNHKRSETAARETAERYRTLFNSMDEGFCVVEVLFDQNNRPTDYRFVEINPAFEKQTGIANALGRTVREIVPQHEQHWYDIYGKVALTGEPLRFENRAQALNRWFDVFAYRVGAPEQRRVAVLFTDITKRKAADQALANAKVELEDYATNLEATVRERTAHLQQTITELEDFSFTVSHDLRSPLRSMQGFACALLNNYAGKLDAQGREYLQRISNSSVRLDRLILEVLDYSRAGRSQLAVVPVNLDKLLEEVMLTYPSIRTADAEIKIKHPLHPVSGSYASLTQCVANLLSNALKFIPAGSKAKIRIWTDKQDSRVRFFVKDNGIGISKEIQSKIFEPFQRGHPHAGYEGTGMGLAIVRKAIQRMHGSVGVESREGKGSTFWLELPAG